jgi:hypothetical protein
VGGAEQVLFTKSGEVGNYWERADVKITGDQPFQLVIEGTSIKKTANGEIALDDITFTPNCLLDNSPFPSITPVPTTTTVPRCGLGNFECKSGQCISNSKVCNFKPDCSDGSDETECGTCDFEKSICGWTDGGNSEFKFVRKQAPSSNPKGPQIDHTTNKTGGYFLYTELDTDSGNFPTTATMFSPVLQATSAYCKISFWLFMDGSFPYADFYYTNASNKYDYTFIKYIYGSQGNGWVKKEFPIGEHPAGFKMEVVAYPDYSNFLDYNEIAFDDIKFIDCSPDDFVIDKSLDCDFEKNFCNYTTELSSSNIQPWVRKANVSNLYDPTGPSFDHTTGNGYYALFKSYTSYPYNKTGSLFSSIQTKNVNVSMCYSMWYHMFGADMGSLSLYIDYFDQISSTEFTRTLMWSKQGTQGDRWFNIERNIKSAKPWRIVIKAQIGKSYLHEIAVDDLKLSMGECAPQKICDFENNFCQWMNTADTTIAPLIWARGLPTTLSSFFDHSTQSSIGSVAYVNMTGAAANDKARLYSPKFKANITECLRFWYVLSSPQDSQVKLITYRSTQTNDTKLGTLLSKVENLQWRFKQYTFEPAAGLADDDYSIVFEGSTTTTANNANTIAIDDVSIVSGRCTPVLDCNFEDSTICNWQQSKYDRMDWLLNSGETDSSQTGFSLIQLEICALCLMKVA